jgi:phospholipid/cholesterol/gamma-HCH transport system substrate-binding protein
LKLSREIKTAVLVIFGVVLFIYLFNYLKGEDLFNNTVTYYTEFDYNALSTNSPVTIRGNAVGKIEDINYDFNTGKTVVHFTVDPRLEFSKNSTVRLYETGIMGGNALAIIDTHDGELAQKGDFIQSEVKPGLVTSLKDNFSGLSSNLDSTLRSADSLMVNLTGVIKDETEDGLKNTIAELNRTLVAYKNLSYSIQSVISDNDEKVASILENFDQASSNITELTEELKSLELNSAIQKFESTLLAMNEVMTKINEGQGSLGKLINEDTLYNNLEAATKEMEELLRDIKLHPKRYTRVLSKKEIPYQPEEDTKQ